MYTGKMQASNRVRSRRYVSKARIMAEMPAGRFRISGGVDAGAGGGCTPGFSCSRTKADMKSRPSSPRSDSSRLRWALSSSAVRAPGIPAGSNRPRLIKRRGRVAAGHESAARISDEVEAAEPERVGFPVDPSQLRLDRIV